MTTDVNILGREMYSEATQLAHHRPLVSGRQLVFDAQGQAKLDAEFALVVFYNNQYLLTPPSQSFLERITWTDDVAAEWRPHSDPKSPVRMSPDIRFGRPAVRGISTEAIWEQAESGADDSEIAEVYGLTVGDVRWGLSYEQSQRSA